MNTPLVYVIVLNWNGLELTRQCLDSLKTITYENFKILVVDNGSTDGSANFLRKNYPEIALLALPKNLGFAKGNNAGFQQIKNEDPDFLIFLNNDTIAAPDFIQPLITPFQSDPNLGQTVSKIYYADQPGVLWYGGGKVNLWTGRIFHIGIRDKDREEYDRPRYVDYATGCCFCVRAVEFDRLGGFDESYPMYGEDVDLSYRLKKNFLKILYVPKSKIWHKVSASIGGMFSFGKLKRKLTGHFRFFRRHAQPYHWITIMMFSPVQIALSLITYLKYKRR